LTLARYTGLALQRLNGSAKKVKGQTLFPSIKLIPHNVKFPGSLLDKTLRIEMDNPIFRKLQEAVEHPCRSKDWFGMAEQAINTIYALGEHPDTLCNNIIKNLTRRAFMPRPKEATPVPEQKDPDAIDEDQPANDKMDEDKTTEGGDVTMTQDGSVQDEQEKDVGDAFELSQLLFVVGHVAIKHIVFLELVEREWKRQKDEKTAGQYFLLSTFLDSLMLMLIYMKAINRRLLIAPIERPKTVKSLIKLLAMPKTRLAIG
jgi:condensin complex subunit 1